MGEPYPPLMTITAASYLRENGFEVDLFDVGLLESESGLSDKIDAFRPDYFVLFDDGFNYLTKMCLTTMREAAFRMQQTAKSFQLTTITCGSDSTDNWEKFHKNGADFVIQGEGEITLLELLERLERKLTHSEVAGISYIESGIIKRNSKRPVLIDLDKLPIPAWDLIDIEDYLNIWRKKNKIPYLNIATTRGCPYKCNWCAKPIYGNRYNSRSPKRVVDEIEFHVTHHNINHFWMCDDIFGLKPGWVKQFRDELNQRNLKIKYKIQSRADLLLQEDNIEALVAAGLDEAWIGAESGSQEVLDAMDKGITIDQIRSSTRILKSFGVKVAFFIQFGYLGETMQDIKKTFHLVLDLMPDKLGVSVSYPLPGTKFFDKVKADLANKQNWVDSDDLDMMFKNTYKPKFYKVLHRYLHNRYVLKRGLMISKELLRHPAKATEGKIKQIASGLYNIPKSMINYLILQYVRFGSK